MQHRLYGPQTALRACVVGADVVGPQLHQPVLGGAPSNRALAPLGDQEGEGRNEPVRGPEVTRVNNPIAVHRHDISVAGEHGEQQMPQAHRLAPSLSRSFVKEASTSGAYERTVGMMMAYLPANRTSSQI